MNLLTLAGLHATGALFMLMGISLMLMGLPDWKPGETARLWDGANQWMIIRGVVLAVIGAAGVMATGVAT